MNTILPLLERIRPVLETRLRGLLRRHSRRPRRIEVQLEFPWAAKR